jgi:hypothetical protein
MTSFRTSVRPYIQISILARSWVRKPSTRFCHFCIFKNKKKKMTDWLHSVRTDGFVHTLHCIALCIVLLVLCLHCMHCIVLCIALHCIALWLHCITTEHCITWLIERNVNSTALFVLELCHRSRLIFLLLNKFKSKFFAINVLPFDRNCLFVCLCLSVTFFFWLRTDRRQTICDWTETKLK